ncbi:MAG: hypothetical protein ACFFCW_14750 [Candidatus Hodarchaeota archaeon]
MHDATLVLFTQEFMNLFSRSSMYYKQMQCRPIRISASTLCEVSDAATLAKFTEITKNSDIVGKVVDLKTWFFQVVRQTDMASAQLALGNQKKAREHQERAMAFFMGDLCTESGEFDRGRYKSYLTNIKGLLDYLEQLNNPSGFRVLMVNLIYSEREQAVSIKEFVESAKEKLAERENELEELRKQEEEDYVKRKGTSRG